MSFKTKAELTLHKRNQCPHEGCGKRFSSHKYAMFHQRVHDDDRPLKCPWKGCSMSFKWAWARTEHIRVHTGERPYKCKVEGCGLSFRFVSDYSRHRRKTGHYVDQPAWILFRSVCFLISKWDICSQERAEEAQCIVVLLNLGSLISHVVIINLFIQRFV